MPSAPVEDLVVPIGRHGFVGERTREAHNFDFAAERGLIVGQHCACIIREVHVGTHLHLLQLSGLTFVRGPLRSGEFGGNGRM